MRLAWWRVGATTLLPSCTASSRWQRFALRCGWRGWLARGVTVCCLLLAVCVCACVCVLLRVYGWVCVAVAVSLWLSCGLYCCVHTRKDEDEELSNLCLGALVKARRNAAPPLSPGRQDGEPQSQPLTQAVAVSRVAAPKTLSERLAWLLEILGSDDAAVQVCVAVAVAVAVSLCRCGCVAVAVAVAAWLCVCGCVCPRTCRAPRRCGLSRASGG